ncbi:MAG: tripartite tricarboxylate transporter substrate-binding protein [Xanthobacteraceae bacterium]
MPAQGLTLDGLSLDGLSPQRSSPRRWLTPVAAAILLACSAFSARAADFYAGKTLTLMVGFAPGGGVDTTARVVGRHLVRFIPGAPTLLVQNMEGAAGLVAMNYLSRRVAADGLTIAMPGRSWYVEGALRSPGVAFDVDKLSYIGSPGGVNSALYVRAATGVHDLASLKAAPRPLTFGTLGATTPTAMVPALLGAKGYPVKIISGYVSTARVLVALEQGEIDGFWTVEDSFARRHDLIDKKLVRPILQTRTHLPGVPLLSDIIPNDLRPLLMLLEAPDNFGLPLVAPAGVAADRVNVLRNAFMAMAADPAYQSDARKAEQLVGEPIAGARLQAMVGELAKDATPDIVTAYRKLETAK